MSINQLVENLLGFGNKLNNDPGLKQGAAFNSMQKQIIDLTLPALPLMEETSMPGLGSIVVESLSNQESAESPLKTVDKKEFKALQKLETEFNQKLTQYVAAYKTYLDCLISPSTSSDVVTAGVGQWGGECRCPNGKTYQVSDNNTYCASLACKGGEKLNCNQESGPWSERSVTCGPPNKDCRLKAIQLQQLNNELLDISNRMWSQIQKLHTTDVKVQKALMEKRTILRKQMHQLQGRRQHHEQVMTSGSTLEGEIEDNRLQLDSLYLQYLVWFFAASTLAVVAFHQVTKKS